MASWRKREGKNGQPTSYEIRVFRGRDKDGHQLTPYTMSWPVPETWSRNKVEKEVARIATDFERDCKAGLVLTKDQQLELEDEQR